MFSLSDHCCGKGIVACLKIIIMITTIIKTIIRRSYSHIHCNKQHTAITCDIMMYNYAETSNIGSFSN